MLRQRRMILWLVIASGVLRLAQAVIDNAWNPLDPNYTPHRLAARIIEVPRTVMGLVIVAWFMLAVFGWMCRWIIGRRSHA